MDLLFVPLTIAAFALLAAFALGVLLGRHFLVSKCAGEALVAKAIEASMPLC